ncbi:aminodeoxychorismate synthase, subunit I [Marininema mesophilum]|uniref:aminodeoxychorismate synthase n=1 Tax=Marininema mesophilum TaxID=1048340 RepID=A0A1H3BAG4_9BACL|nr:aminodeoxychorismate synthase component I [Marininema mesophilum]SDX38942.1 aminodeoxychorismate synthase, subunit I [Marininema mesophilum]
MRVAWRRVEEKREGTSLFAHFIGGSQIGIYLDSCEKGRYDVIAWEPVRSRKLNHGEGDSPFSVLDELVSQIPTVEDTPVDAPPFLFGVLGYFSYEAAWDEEWIGLPKERLDPVHDVYFMIPGKVIVLDHEAEEMWLVVTTLEEDPDPSLDSLVAEVLHLSQKKLHPQGGELVSPLTAEIDVTTYRERLGRVQEYIARGDIYQANLSYQVEGRVAGDSWDLYCVLRKTNPGAYAAYIRMPTYAILSSSPEQFIRRQGDMIKTRPIKGTRPRGATEEEDEQYRDELAGSEKDQAELVMIVDLERNDFGRVCAMGSVEVTDLFAIDPHPTVWHQSAQVTGRLPEGTSMGEVLRMAFPGGSITGAPKIRSMQVIHELENQRRGIYTGSIGYVDPRGSSEWNIAIRTMTWVGGEGRLSYRVGGGIVADSDPDLEFAETLAKGQGMVRAIEEWTATPAMRRLSQS